MTLDPSLKKPSFHTKQSGCFFAEITFYDKDMIQKDSGWHFGLWHREWEMKFVWRTVVVSFQQETLSILKGWMSRFKWDWKMSKGRVVKKISLRPSSSNWRMNYFRLEQCVLLFIPWRLKSLKWVNRTLSSGFSSQGWCHKWQKSG